jgi:hypothetical protein
MIHDPEKIALLVAQLEKDFFAAHENLQLNEKAWGRIRQGAVDDLDWAALGYTLNVLYTSMENYFRRISKYFENDLPSESWHKELIERMQLELPNIRPALLDRETALLCEELLGFRHIFRTFYDRRLDPERIRLIQKKIPDLFDKFAMAHKHYIEKLADMV